MTDEQRAHEARLLSQGRSDEPMFPEGGGIVVWALMGLAIMFVAYMAVRAFVL